MTTPTAPRRRWFRFSLRTMFLVVAIVAVFAGWLGGELRWVHKRQDFLRWLYEKGNDGKNRGCCLGYPNDDPLSKSIPFYRRWLGDQAVGYIDIFAASPEEREAARRLFPEAAFQAQREW